MKELSLNSLELVPRERLRDLSVDIGVVDVGLACDWPPKAAAGLAVSSSLRVLRMRLSCRLDDRRSQGLVDGSAFRISRSDDSLSFNLCSSSLLLRALEASSL